MEQIVERMQELLEEWAQRRLTFWLSVHMAVDAGIPYNDRVDHALDNVLRVAHLKGLPVSNIVVRRPVFYENTLGDVNEINEYMGHLITVLPYVPGGRVFLVSDDALKDIEHPVWRIDNGTGVQLHGEPAEEYPHFSVDAGTAECVGPGSGQ